MAAPVRKDDQSITEVLVELKELTVSYAKQETVDPLKGLGRYVGFGAGGSVCLAIGALLLAIGLLRVLQTQTGTAFTGNLSWLPYVFTLLFLAAVIGLAVYAIFKDARQHKHTEETP